MPSLNFINKETLAQVFFFEFCEIFKNTYFYRTPLRAACQFLLLSLFVKASLAPL